VLLMRQVVASCARMKTRVKLPLELSISTDARSSHGVGGRMAVRYPSGDEPLLARWYTLFKRTRCDDARGPLQAV